MRHFRNAKFRDLYGQLPADIRATADKSDALLKENPKHPSLHFKCIRDDLWSVRVGRNYRALAVAFDDGFVWFWIGPHKEYDRLVG
jgi:hypothetical protein